MHRERLAAGLVRTALVLTFGISLGVLALGDSEGVRANAFGHSRHCLNERLTRNLSGREILLIGSSRMREALEPGRLAAALDKDAAAVLNLGHPDRDVRLDAVLIEQISGGAPLELVAAELHVGSTEVSNLELKLDPGVPEPFVLASGTYADSFIYGASYAQLARAGSSPSPLLTVYDFLNLTVRKIDRTVKVLIVRRAFRPPQRPDANVDYGRTNICARQHPRLEAGTDRQRALKRSFQTAFRQAPAVPGGWRTDHTDFLTDPRRAGDRAAVMAVVDQGRRDGFQVVFIYLPAAYAPLPTQEFRAAFTNHFGAPILIPPAALLEPLYEDGYYDNSHLNTDGRAIFTRWFSTQIADLGTGAR